MLYALDNRLFCFIWLWNYRGSNDIHMDFSFSHSSPNLRWTYLNHTKNAIVEQKRYPMTYIYSEYHFLEMAPISLRNAFMFYFLTLRVNHILSFYVLHFPPLCQSHLKFVLKERSGAKFSWQSLTQMSKVTPFFIFFFGYMCGNEVWEVWITLLI